MSCQVLQVVEDGGEARTSRPEYSITRLSTKSNILVSKLRKGEAPRSKLRSISGFLLHAVPTAKTFQGASEEKAARPRLHSVLSAIHPHSKLWGILAFSREYPAGAIAVSLPLFPQRPRGRCLWLCHLNHPGAAALESSRVCRGNPDLNLPADPRPPLPH